MMNIENKRFLLYGLGKANRAILYYFNQHQILYDIYIDSLSKDIDNFIEELPDLTSFDYLVKSPGIPFDTELINKVKEKGIPIIGDLELFYLINPQKQYIGITGSNGKTTTTVLLTNILETTYKVEMAGNVGIPIFSTINEELDYLVVECSSFMLNDTCYFHPHIYIILNIEHHHLNIHQTFSNYVEAKLKPLSQMNDSDLVVYNYDDKILRRQMSNYHVKKKAFSLKGSNLFANCYLVDDAIYYENELFIKITSLNLQEDHNIQNMMATIIVSKYLGIDDDKIRKCLMSFKTLPHRLEKILDKPNIVVYNDSKATNPYATIKAIETISKHAYDQEIIWIVGGEAKHDDYTPLNHYLNEIDYIYLYGENQNELLNTFMLSKNKIKYEIHQTLEEIIQSISKRMNKNTIILFSPASASHDMYENFEVRGNEFKKLIHKYL